MSAAEAQGWKEAIAAGAFKGKQKEGEWVLNLDAAIKEQKAAQEARDAQDQVLQNIPTEIKFNQQKADSIAKIRTQYADALDDMRQYAE
jgi:hypothetical protein